MSGFVGFVFRPIPNRSGELVLEELSTGAIVSRARNETTARWLPNGAGAETCSLRELYNLEMG